jgi:hypothetical protein
MLTFFVAWMLVTLASAVGLLAFLAFDQWQVRARSASGAQRPEQATSAKALQAA